MPDRWLPGRRSAWLLGLFVLLALFFALARWGQPVYDLLSAQDGVRAWVGGLGAWGPAAIFGLELAQSLMAPIPSPGIEAAAGYLYGLGWGLLYCTAGIYLGSIVTFSLTRRYGRPLVTRLVSRRSMERVDDLVRRGGSPFFFLIWLVPFAPDDLACVAAGLTCMPARRFLLLMILGRFPGIATAVAVGAYAIQLNPVWWAAALTLIAAGTLLVWWRSDEIQAAWQSLLESLGRRLF
ncbi:MAG: TVP38/TMEM64 family protein [Anaerolineae bacterium]|nr:TVP38/TMEM64 family protein [Anaerolineae bacterium]